MSCDSAVMTSLSVGCLDADLDVHVDASNGHVSEDTVTVGLWPCFGVCEPSDVVCVVGTVRVSALVLPVLASVYSIGMSKLGMPVAAAGGD